MPTGVSMPPPAPCRMRNSTSSSTDCESPQSADATREQRDRPAMKVRLVPNRSPTHPEAGIHTARLTRYPTSTPVGRRGTHREAPRDRRERDRRRWSCPGLVMNIADT